MQPVATTLNRLGGVGSWSELRSRHSARAVRSAVRRGEVVRVGRGRYTLPQVAAQRRSAVARTATLSHLSAAVHHGWKVAKPPDVAWVTVPRRRHLRHDLRDGICPHWADLGPAEVDHGVTTPLRTVLDCARVLAFTEALAVADSALRARAVTASELSAAAGSLRGPGAGQVRRVVASADRRAANPFESVLRALALEEGLHLVPQLVVTGTGLFAVVDLGDDQLRLAVEADGFETHGTRRGLRKDARRHTELAVNAWSSLRFSYEDVMYEPEWTRWALRSWRDARSGVAPADPPARRRPEAA